MRPLPATPTLPNRAPSRHTGLRLMVATGCLPQRNTLAADFQQWLASYVIDVTPAAHRLLLQEYGTWRLLPRLRQPRGERPQTYSALPLAKSRIKAARQFLVWLVDRDTTLAQATQADLDEFLATHPETRPNLQPFILWAVKHRKSRTLECPRRRSNQPKPAASADERWTVLRRLLHDTELDIGDRMAGAILLYAQPLSRVLQLRRSDVTIEHDDDHDQALAVRLRIGEEFIHLPSPLNELVASLVTDSGSTKAAITLEPSDWLFPGTKPGHPRSEARMKVRLRQLGLKPGPGRSRALIHLAQRLEAPLLARILGLHPSTANRWSELAGRTYSGYVDRAAQRGRTLR